VSEEPKIGRREGGGGGGQDAGEEIIGRKVLHSKRMFNARQLGAASA